MWSNNTHQGRELLNEQPIIRELLGKKAYPRHGRLVVEYLVAFHGFPDEEAEWYAVNDIRNRYEGGAEIVRGYEAYQEAKTGLAKKAVKTLAPQTQEPYTLAATETQSQLDDVLFQTRPAVDAEPNADNDTPPAKGDPGPSTSHPILANGASSKAAAPSSLQQGPSSETAEDEEHLEQPGDSDIFDPFRPLAAVPGRPRLPSRQQPSHQRNASPPAANGVIAEGMPVSAADPGRLQDALSTVPAANGHSGPVQQTAVSENPPVQPSAVVAPAAEREAPPALERETSLVQPRSAPAGEEGATPLQPSATPAAERRASPVQPPAAASRRSPTGQLLQPSERPMSAGQQQRQRAVPNSLQPGYLWAPDHAEPAGRNSAEVRRFATGAPPDRGPTEQPGACQQTALPGVDQRQGSSADNYSRPTAAAAAQAAASRGRLADLVPSIPRQHQATGVDPGWAIWARVAKSKLAVAAAAAAWRQAVPGGATAPAAAAAQTVSGSEDAQASGSTRDVVQVARDGADSTDGSTDQTPANLGGSAPGGEVDKSGWDVWRSVVQAAKQHMSPSVVEAAKRQMSPSLAAAASLPVSNPARVEPEHPAVPAVSHWTLPAQKNVPPASMPEGRVASAQCRPRGMERPPQSSHAPASIPSPVAPGGVGSGQQSRLEGRGAPASSSRAPREDAAQPPQAEARRPATRGSPSGGPASRAAPSEVPRGGPGQHRPARTPEHRRQASQVPPCSDPVGTGLKGPVGTSTGLGTLVETAEGLGQGVEWGGLQLRGKRGAQEARPPASPPSKQQKIAAGKKSTSMQQPTPRGPLTGALSPVMNVLVQASAGMAADRSGRGEAGLQPAAPAGVARAHSETAVEENEDIDMDCDESLDDLGGLPPAVRQRMGPRLWEQAAIVGARQIDSGLDLHIQWADGFDAWIFHSHLKERPHCLLKLVNFYESKTRRKARTPPQQAPRGSGKGHGQGESSEEDSEPSSAAQN